MLSICLYLEIFLIISKLNISKAHSFENANWSYRNKYIAKGKSTYRQKNAKHQTFQRGNTWKSRDEEETTNDLRNK